MRTEADNLDAESKIAKAINSLRRIRPFYSAIYESMKRIENNEIDTMGVSVDKILYNKSFVEKLEFAEFMFVNLHEIAHVALMHTTRCKNRDPQIWNIAADLYVNKLLSDEFSIQPGQKDKENDIKFLKGGCYCSTIDLDIDYTENIYDAIIDDLKKQGYTGLSSDIGKTFKITYTGSSDNNSYFCDSDDKYSKFSAEIKITGSSDDLIKGEGSDIENESEARRLLSEASVRNEMRNAGSTTGRLELMVKDILKSHVDWKKLLRKYCIRVLSSDSTFSNPDKRMFYQDAIYPGQSLDEKLSIKGVKVCFDSSGSISKEDIAYFYGQVKELMKEFKIDTEVIYWDTEAYSMGKTDNVNDIINKGGYGRGGTDPSCLFEYFDSKKCSVKPVVTLIFTDGYIIETNLNKTKWKRKYKDTIWIMTKNYNTTFKPPFGTVTKAKYSN